MFGMTAATAARTLLERESQLDLLRAGLGDALAGSGHLFLVTGEAGVGKTSLVSSFCAEARGRARVLTGACDPLATPRPLGPFADIAADVGGELASLVAADARAHELLDALFAELRQRPTVLVLEDLHWADEATLDLVRLLGRRAEATRALVIGTYRDDELAATHALRLVLGGLATARGIERLRLEPLSLSAVRVMSLLHDVDATELHRLTGGNPFFVTEALAAGGGVPETVRDAVLARAARLAPRARRTLDTVALVPGHAEFWLLEEIAPDHHDGLAACLSAGMLIEQRDAVAFRHELARRAIEESVEPPRRRRLHRAILAVLAETRVTDHTRLAHHAVAAGDADAVLAHAPIAAERAASMGAHREAAALYESALRFSTDVGDRELADLLGRYARECELTEQLDDAIAAHERALDIYRVLGDRLNEGNELRFLSRVYGLTGRLDEMDETARAAVALLEPLGATGELAHAYLRMASMYTVDLELEAADEWSRRALRLAEAIGDDDIRLDARYYVFQPDTPFMLETLELARLNGDDDHVAHAYAQLAFTCTRRREWPTADKAFEGIPYTLDRDLDGEHLYLLAWRAVANLHRARWDDAAHDANAVLADSRNALSRTTGLLVMSLLRARRGDPGAWEAYDEVLETMRRASKSAQKHTAAAAARMELAVIGARPELTAREPWERPLAELSDRWMAGELTVWRRRAGVLDEDPGPLPQPFALELAGDHAGAASRWRELGCPYDAAVAAAWSDDDETALEGYEALIAIEAGGTARVVARRLRTRGVRGLTRGPRTATRRSPGQLTRRELDVIRLLAEGLRNADIAGRLFLSRRTVDHHVSAVLRKLGTRTRGEAVAEARRLGVLEDP
jgi:DNA-binding CsgD family transcriptional regulator